MIGIPSGLRNLDNITNGWQNGDVIILAARPSVGKTAFAINLSLNAANIGIGIGFFSLEMSTSMIMKRIGSTMSGIELEKIQKGNLNHYELQAYRNGLARFSKLNFHIDDTGGISLQQLKAKARKMVLKEKVGFIIIDYLQLMEADDKGISREQQISELSRGVKRLAKELGVPILNLSQLSREVEKRGGQSGNAIPRLSDLRESGAIEQDADLVIFLHREDYQKYDNQVNPEKRGEALAIVAKHRNGTTGAAILHFEKRTQIFTDKNTSDVFTQIEQQTQQNPF